MQSMMNFTKQNPRPQMGLAILGHLWALGLLLLPLTAVADDAPLTVTVSILPQVWFVEEIGGDEVSVAAMVGPGHSPATFEPTGRQMARLQESLAFFSAGVPFEHGLLPRIENSANMPPIRGPRPQGHAHTGDDHHHHHHEDELDPHTWLDPLQASALADTIGRVLSQLVPEKAPLFEARTLQLKTRLADLNREVALILAPVKGRSFFVYHPAYGHFAAAYGLKQVAVESQGQEPGPRQLAMVIDQVRDSGCKAIIVQPQFSQKSAQAVARSTGAEILVLDPLAPTYDQNLLHIARTLAQALEGGQP